MKIITKVFLCLVVIILYVGTCYAIEKNPPIGSFPSAKLDISFLFKQGDKIFFPPSIHYLGKSSIKVSSFPSGKIEVFVKVEQSLVQEEGSVMYKLVRVYNREVMNDRKGKVRLWTGRSFYQKIQRQWEKTLHKAHTFGLKQINDYANGTTVDGINKALSLSWNQSKDGMLSNKEIKKHLELNFTDNKNNSLFTIGFIHFSAFNGVRWLPIDVFISEEEGYLKDVYLDVFVMKGSNITLQGKYWLGVE